MAEKVSKEHDIAREQHSEAESQSSDEAWRSKSRPKQAERVETKQTHQDPSNMPSPSEQQTYNWCQCSCEPAQHGGRDHYYLHFVTRESRWEEPEEPYWIWDAATQAVSGAGLQYPAAPQKTRGAPGTEVGQPAADLDPDYQGYNPKVHGSYDPNAPYAQFHRQRMEDEEELANPSLAVSQPIGVDADYATAGTFNRFTGAYQTEDKSADRHNDANKSNRQLNAFFDVDAAANAHEGKSLKAERQQQKLSKKEIKELSEKRRAKKEKKRMDFYRT